MIINNSYITITSLFWSCKLKTILKYHIYQMCKNRSILVSEYYKINYYSTTINAMVEAANF